jgi:hypothetical protein
MNTSLYYVRLFTLKHKPWILSHGSLRFTREAYSASIFILFLGQ